MPESKGTPTLRHTKLPSRAKSFVIDMFMIYTPILYVMTYVVYGGASDFRGSNAAPLFSVILFILIDALLNGTRFYTPGKKAYEQQVVDAVSGKRLGFFRYLVRAVLFLGFASLLFGFVTPFFRKDRRGLHDILTHSAVVEKADS